MWIARKNKNINDRCFCARLMSAMRKLIEMRRLFSYFIQWIRNVRRRDEKKDEYKMAKLNQMERELAYTHTNSWRNGWWKWYRESLIFSFSSFSAALFVFFFVFYWNRRPFFVHSVINITENVPKWKQYVFFFFFFCEIENELDGELETWALTFFSLSFSSVTQRSCCHVVNGKWKCLSVHDTFLSSLIFQLFVRSASIDSTVFSFDIVSCRWNKSALATPTTDKNAVHVYRLYRFGVTEIDFKYWNLIHDKQVQSEVSAVKIARFPLYLFFCSFFIVCLCGCFQEKSRTFDLGE